MDHSYNDAEDETEDTSFDHHEEAELCENATLNEAAEETEITDLPIVVMKRGPVSPTNTLYSRPVKRVKVYSKQDVVNMDTSAVDNSVSDDKFMSAITAVEKIFAGRNCTSVHDEDQDDVFGRYIAGELRDIKDAQVKRLAKHQIQTILYNAHSGIN